MLSLSEGNVIETVEMDTDKLHGFKFYGDGGDKSKVNSVDRNRKQLSVGESVYDCKWYPLMNIQDDNTNCFVTTCRDHPITLWDAPAGTVRATTVELIIWMNWMRQLACHLTWQETKSIQAPTG